MTTLEAHDRLAVRPDRSLLPAAALLGGVDVWPAFVAALASVSGMLEDSRTDADLDEAVRHGWTLLQAGVVELAAVESKTKAVIAELWRWGQAVDAAGGPQQLN